MTSYYYNFSTGCMRAIQSIFNCGLIEIGHLYTGCQYDMEWYEKTMEKELIKAYKVERKDQLPLHIQSHLTNLKIGGAYLGYGTKKPENIYQLSNQLNLPITPKIAHNPICPNTLPNKIQMLKEIEYLLPKTLLYTLHRPTQPLEIQAIAKRPHWKLVNQVWGSHDDTPTINIYVRPKDNDWKFNNKITNPLLEDKENEKTE